eukprot:Filipodium_phascolosomae@DN1873_c0_g1_i3.p2
MAGANCTPSNSENRLSPKQDGYFDRRGQQHLRVKIEPLDITEDDDRDASLETLPTHMSRKSSAVHGYPKGGRMDIVNIPDEFRISTIAAGDFFSCCVGSSGVTTNLFLWGTVYFPLVYLVSGFFLGKNTDNKVHSVSLPEYGAKKADQMKVAAGNQSI